MLITKASEYALLSLIVLAKAKDPLDSETLSRELAISKSFLAKILQSMSREGILKSYKGVNGGFVIDQSPKDISLLSVMCAAEGKNPSVMECAPSVNDCPSDKALTCSLWPIINKLQGKIDNFLGTLYLSDLIEE